jgi:hypothetical protein
MIDSINRIDVEAASTGVTGTSSGRLEYAVAKIDARKEDLDEQAKADGVPPETVRYIGPAFEVHVWGDPLPLVADDECRELLETILRSAKSCGFVVLFHADAEQVCEALALHSTLLVSALVVGQSLRLAGLR